MNQWSFLQIGCSSLVGACHIHWGIMLDNQWTIAIDNLGVELPEVYHTEISRSNWGALNAC